MTAQAILRVILGPDSSQRVMVSPGLPSTALKKMNEVVPLDSEKEDNDPISKAFFYRKDKPDKKIPITQSELEKKYKKKKLEEMKKDLRDKLIERFREDKLEVIDVTLDYGMEDNDPISKAFFYRKDKPDKAIPISKSKVSKLLPQHFSDEILRVYWKNHEGLQGEGRKNKEKEIKKFFKTQCKDYGFEIQNAEEDGGNDSQTPVPVNLNM